MQKKTYYVEYLLPLLPMLDGYEIAKIPIGTASMLVVAILILIKNGFTVKLDKEFLPFLLFFCYAFVKDAIRSVSGNSLVSASTNRMILYTLNFVLLFIICSDTFDEDKLFKMYKIVGAFYSAGLIVQLFQIHVLHQEVMGISLLPGYTFSNTNELWRPRSFFSEPSHFAIAMLPLVFLSLKKRQYIWAGFSTAMICASTSIIGILLSLVIWGIELLLLEGMRKLKLIFIGCGCLAVLAIFTLPMFDYTARKLIAVFFGGSTMQNRVLFGFDVVRGLKPLELVFGTNYNEVYDYISQNIDRYAELPIVMKIYLSGKDYVFMNAIALSVFRYGIIGLLLFLSGFSGKLLRKSYGARSCAIMWLIAALGHSALLNSTYFWIFIMLICYARQDTEKKSLKIRGYRYESIAY